MSEIYCEENNNNNNNNEFYLRENSFPSPIDVSQINIYRYKFSQHFMDKLYEFSKIHQYDDRKVFKESWSKWTDENQDDVNEEFRRLENLNYNGDILDKMFKSARYYFRKKSTAKKVPKVRRVYVSCHKDILDAMDEHIHIGLNNNKMNNQSLYKPSEGFAEFCTQYTDLLREEIIRLINGDGKMSDAHEISEKIKKTYKNRYFMLISK